MPVSWVFSLFAKKYNYLAQFSIYNKVRKHTMALIRILIPVSSTHIPHIRGVGVIYKFFKRSTISEGKSGINLCENIFGTSDKSEVLQYMHYACCRACKMMM